jgi:DNA-binding transcriptional regulator YiaG
MLLTPDEIRLARESLGLSQQGLADALSMGTDGARRVRAWEKGDREITGPASVAIRLMVERAEGKTLATVKPLNLGHSIKVNPPA